MPTELRHLLFQPAEILQAIGAYYRRLGEPLPAGAVLSCGPEPGGEGDPVAFRITLAPEPADPRNARKPASTMGRNLIIEGSALAASLILYCRDRRIPLPAHAEKSLRLFGNQLCLVVTINPRKGDPMPVGLM